jgi:four helix bundle protein
MSICGRKGQTKGLRDYGTAGLRDYGTAGLRDGGTTGLRDGGTTDYGTTGLRKGNMGESFRQLEVWQRAVEMTLAIYQLTKSFPDSERFGLTNQLRRAAVSVASNIAEGYGRSTRGEYIQFLGHARGSICEVETQLVIARGLGLGYTRHLDVSEELCKRVSSMLRVLIKRLRPQNPAVP